MRLFNNIFKLFSDKYKHWTSFSHHTSLSKYSHPQHTGKILTLVSSEGLYNVRMFYDKEQFHTLWHSFHYNHTNRCKHGKFCLHFTGRCNECKHRTNKKVHFSGSNEKLSCEAVVRFPLFIEYCEDQTIVTEIILCCDSLTNIDNTQLSNNCWTLSSSSLNTGPLGTVPSNNNDT